MTSRAPPRSAQIRERPSPGCTPSWSATDLVAWTAGNVSARVPGQDLMVIKPSGVSYDDLTAGIDGRRAISTAPSSTATSARPATPPRTPTSTGRMPEVGGVVHTH